ncbi:hypothetical protein CE11_01050 [Megavirus courdo11]|uniref:Uncharacterized protein n=1 Tax=Megavirus courdo11 TaxID=1128140 RepID=K7Z964_9VIRU|nr:hypothetical protein CE11_01050 [Megavirus courdo11]
MDWENPNFNLSNVDLSDSNLIQELNLQPYPDLSTICNAQEKYNTIKDFFTNTINNLQYLDTERETLFSKLRACEIDSQIYKDIKIDFIKVLYKSVIIEHQRDRAFEYLKNNRTN